jgi:hypothetical protein
MARNESAAAPSRAICRRAVALISSRVACCTRSRWLWDISSTALNDNQSVYIDNFCY